MQENSKVQARGDLEKDYIIASGISMSFKDFNGISRFFAKSYKTYFKC